MLNRSDRFQNNELTTSTTTNGDRASLYSPTEPDLTSDAYESVPFCFVRRARCKLNDPPSARRFLLSLFS